jgi:ABC-2 type transport system permease protein
VNALASPSTNSRGVSSARILGLEVRNEFLKLLRMPAFALPALFFPWMFYVLFGLVLPSGRSMGASGSTMSAYLLATYGVFGVLGVSLFSLGAGMAIERGQGWATVRRAMPSSTPLHLMARLTVASTFGLTVVVGLCILAATFGGVRLPTTQWALLLAVVALCALPFGAVGLALGQMLGPNSAAGVINAVYLPMSFLSGLWIPLQILPKALQAAAPIWPSYHASQVALSVVGGQAGALANGSVWSSVLALGLFTVGGFLVAARLQKRAAARTWG